MLHLVEYDAYFFSHYAAGCCPLIPSLISLPAAQILLSSVPAAALQRTHEGHMGQDGNIDSKHGNKSEDMLTQACTGKEMEI